MGKQNLHHWFLPVLVPFFIGLALLPLTPVASVTFKAKGSPQKTTGGATRGICLQRGVRSSQDLAVQQSFVPLIPATEGELTAATYPTVLVKIAEPEVLKAEFSLWDDQGNGIYQTTVPLTGKPGIISLKVPSTGDGLSIGKQYKWTVAVICNPAERQRDVVLEGYWQRMKVSPVLKRQLNAAKPLEKAKIYAENGFWYDTVATLAELKRSRPNDTLIATEWQELLQSVGLSELSQEPLVNSRE